MGFSLEDFWKIGFIFNAWDSEGNKKKLLYRLVLIKKTWIGTLFWVGLLSETQINNILLELHWNCSCIFDDNLLSNF